MPIAQRSIHLAAASGTNIVAIRLTGTLDREDYELFLPALEEAIQRHGSVRLLVEFVDFHGCTAAAMWEDLKFDVKHYFHVERVAIVGSRTWERAMAMFSKPFTAAKVLYFDERERADALNWIESDDEDA